MTDEKVNVLLVDDQPDKLLAYEVILGELGENLVKTSSAREALQFLLKNDVAVVLIDVCMPELDGFQLAAMIREHPRFRKTAIIFISAIHLTDVDRLRGYEMGAVDYVPVPVVPEVLRAKVRVFAELFRKTRELEQLNSQARAARGRAHRGARSLERAAHAERAGPQPGARRRPDGLVGLGSRHRRMEVGRGPAPHLRRRSAKVQDHGGEYSRRSFIPTIGARSSRAVARHVRRARARSRPSFACCAPTARSAGASAPRPRASMPPAGCVRISGVTIDITDRKEADERQVLLAREVDHRARNALAVIQSIIRLTRAKSVDDYVQAIEGRIKALARAHTLLSDSRWHGADLGDAGRRGIGALSGRRQDHDRAGPIFRCSPRPRRGSRWRCTSSPPMRQSTARCRR